MKNKKLLAILLLILAIIVSLAGCDGDKKINYGIDIVVNGSLCAVYDYDYYDELSQQQRDSIESSLEKIGYKFMGLFLRNGYTETYCTKENGRIRIVILSDDAPEKILDLISLITLEFKEYVDGADGDCSFDDINSVVKLDSKITSADIKYVTVVYDSDYDFYKLELIFTEEGTKKMQIVTSALVDRRISIWINDEFILAPTVNKMSENSKVFISGNYSYDNAYELAIRIQTALISSRFIIKTGNVLK
ncbi:MAG: hypothetical protein K2O35_04850 [Clostridia bacterium]|nr:hypothetical protein [Clostridia bacterium]